MREQQERGPGPPWKREWSEGVQGEGHYQALPLPCRDPAYRPTHRVAHLSSRGQGGPPRNCRADDGPLGSHPPMASQTPSTVAPVGGCASSQPPTTAARTSRHRRAEATDHRGVAPRSSSGHEALHSCFFRPISHRSPPSPRSEVVHRRLGQRGTEARRPHEAGQDRFRRPFRLHRLEGPPPRNGPRRSPSPGAGVGDGSPHKGATTCGEVAGEGGGCP